MPNSSDFSPFYAVTGTQCLLPQLLIDSTSEEAITQNFTRDLHKTMSQFDVRDFPKRSTKSAKSYVPEKLQTCDKVWIRVDHVRRPVEAPYSGPYMVYGLVGWVWSVTTYNEKKLHLTQDKRGTSNN